jgi:hypothetical protein
MIASLYLGLADQPSALAILEAEGEPRQPETYTGYVLEGWDPPVNYLAVVDQTADRLVNLLAAQATPELPGPRPRPAKSLVVHAAGGKPVYDLVVAMAKEKLLPVKVHGVSMSAADGFYHTIPEAVLVSSLEVLVQQQRLLLDRDDKNVPVLFEELRAHGDKEAGKLPGPLLLAVAAGVWWGERHKPLPSMAPYCVGGARLADCSHPFAGVAAAGLVGPTGCPGAPWFPAGRIAKPTQGEPKPDVVTGGPFDATRPRARTSGG